MNTAHLRRLVSKTALRRVFVLLVLVSIAVTIRAQGGQLRSAFDRIGPTAILLSLLAVLAGLFASSLCWRSLLASLGDELPLRLSTHVFFLGQLGKYLPGSVFAVGAQAELARNHGVQRTRVVTAGLVFLAVLTATGLFVAVALLPFTGPEVLRAYWWALLALPPLLGSLVPRVLTRLLELVLRLTRRPPLDQPLAAGHLGRGVGWALVMWLLYGMHLVPLVLAQPHNHGPNILLASIGGYALAWTAGFLFVIAPAGAGIREAVLVLALAGLAGRQEALAVALLSRGVQTAGDLILAGVGAGLSRTAPLPAAQEPSGPRG